MPSDRFLRTALALALVAALAACGSGKEAAAPTQRTPAVSPATPEPAPVLPTDPRELPDFTPEQFDAMLADVTAGTPVVVNFYGSWCGPCKDEAPVFAKMSRKYDSVQFIGVDLLDTKDAARRFLDTYDIPYPSVFDPSAGGDIRSSFGFVGQPATLFFNYGGEESYRWEGEMTEDQLERAIRPLLPSA